MKLLDNNFVRVISSEDFRRRKRVFFLAEPDRVDIDFLSSENSSK